MHLPCICSAVCGHQPHCSAAVQDKYQLQSYSQTWCEYIELKMTFIVATYGFLNSKFLDSRYSCVTSCVYTSLTLNPAKRLLIAPWSATGASLLLHYRRIKAGLTPTDIQADSLVILTQSTEARPYQQQVIVCEIKTCACTTCSEPGVDA